MNRTWVGMGVGAACMAGIACGADGEMVLKREAPRQTTPAPASSVSTPTPTPTSASHAALPKSTDPPTGVTRTRTASGKCGTIFHACFDPPRLTRARLLPYEPEDRGKFLELCFDRAFDSRETYLLSLTITASTGSRFECSLHLSTSYGGSEREGQKCHRENLYNCFNRHTPHVQREAMRTDVQPGTVPAIALRLADTIYPKEDFHEYTLRAL